MREMKDSGIEWIGEIPSHWRLDHLGRYFNNNTFLNKAFEIKQASQFFMGTIIPKNEKGELSDYMETYVSYTIVEEGDIIINGLNLNFDLKSLRVAVVTKRSIITSAYIVLRPNSDRYINSSYFGYLLKSLDYQKVLHGMGKGVRLTLSFEELKRMWLPVPKQSEQISIVNFLDKKCGEIEALIGVQDEMIAKLEDYRKSVITETVTRGLNSDVPLRDSGIDWLGQIPEHWDTCKIKHIFKVFSGATPDTKNNQNWDGEIVWITPADFSTWNYYISDSSRKITKRGMEECATTIIPEGSLIISKRAPIGTIAISKIPLCTNQGCFGCVKKYENQYNRYYFFLLSVYSEILESLGAGTTFKELSTQKFTSLMVPRPSAQEQNIIVNFLDKKCSEIDSLIDVKREKIEKLKEYKKSLIFEYVTGKKEVV